MTAKKNIIVILGPTASGKTAAALALGKLLDVEAISADSRQIYRYLDIGTAKPTPEELNSLKHHFIDIKNPDEPYSAGLFGEEAEAVALDIISRGNIPVAVGGSGLYIKALCEGFFDEKYLDKKKLDAVRRELTARLEDEGVEELYKELMEADPASAALYSDRNPRRILRALEFCMASGKPFSAAHRKNTERKISPLYFGVHLKRDVLYDRINRRAALMWESGLPEETQRIFDMGYSPALNSLNTVGYKECAEYLRGGISKEEALNKIRQNTRRYAKRQATWFRKVEKVYWISGTSGAIAEKIYNTYKKAVLFK